MQAFTKQCALSFSRLVALCRHRDCYFHDCSVSESNGFEQLDLTGFNYPPRSTPSKTHITSSFPATGSTIENNSQNAGS